MADVLKSNPPSLLFKKRKAENYENNERLSKRLSLLNLERSGQKLFNPPQPPIACKQDSISHFINQPTSNSDLMQIEDTKNKVFIHDLEAEILEVQSEEAKFIIHPEIEKHLRDCRFSPQIITSFSSSHEDKQLVLYNDPSSITIPEEFDSVKRIIIETRSRIREKQDTQNKEMLLEQPAEQLSGRSVDNQPSYYQPNSIFDSNSSQQHQENDPDIMDLDML
ncbi:hypothetical protein EV44_g6269 [Erysiphe necator]|uniref:Uncharacterized protein n=1 Tax=Uncinula necator TaxID=52586 RepID=A0A0B1PCL3_UNCNE|nr:hypothetical protein EV44_g6269 [Erysiphe necator]